MNFKSIVVLLLLLSLFILLKSKKSTKNTSDKSCYQPTQKDYLAGQLFYEAKSLIKEGYVEKAINKFWESIYAGEKSEDWIKYGPAPAMYRELAKIYYHTNQDKKALEVIDRYNKFGGTHSEMIVLREKIANKKFRRLKNKYS